MLTRIGVVVTAFSIYMANDDPVWYKEAIIFLVLGLFFSFFEAGCHDTFGGCWAVGLIVALPMSWLFGFYMCLMIAGTIAAMHQTFAFIPFHAYMLFSGEMFKPKRAALPPSKTRDNYKENNNYLENQVVNATNITYIEEDDSTVPMNPK